MRVMTMMMMKRRRRRRRLSMMFLVIDVLSSFRIGFVVRSRWMDSVDENLSLLFLVIDVLSLFRKGFVARSRWGCHDWVTHKTRPSFLVVQMWLLCQKNKQTKMAK